MIFVAYELNLPLNMEKPHYRSQRAGEWSLIWAHDSRQIYRALTYITVPLLRPHQPRYIGLTLYLSQKWSDCHETKSKHINWTHGLKCDHRVWPWPWPWSWIFKAKYEICSISAKSGPIATKWKAYNRLNSRPQMWPMGLTLTMTLTFEFLRSNVTLTFDRTHCLAMDSCFSEWAGRLTLNKRGGSRSFMTMTGTIWWPRSGVRI